MLSKWTSLPIEILGIIFNDYIESSSQLAKCRLVCRSWNSTAEVAMLGKQLDLESIDRNKFYQYISKKPELAKHIKDIKPTPCYGIKSISPKQTAQTEIDVKLWKIICTENLRSITGALDDMDVFDKVHDIIEESLSGFANLKRLDTYAPNEPVYIDLVYLLRETLQQAAMSETAMDSLDQFEKLEILDYHAYHDGSIATWENVLRKGINNLTTLRIHFTRHEDVEEPLESLTTEQVKTWVHRHQVQQFTHLKHLDYEGETYLEDWSPTMCEYLLYKFPKLQSVKFSIPTSVDPKDQNFIRVVKAIKAVENYHINYSLAAAHKLDVEFEVGKTKDGNDNRMTIEWTSNTSEAFVRVDHQQRSTTIDIILPLDSNDQGLSLLDIQHATEFSLLKLNFRKASGLRAKHQSREHCQDSGSITQSLIQALTAFQHMRTMEIGVYQLTLEMTKQLPVHDELTSLEIVGALIQSDAFSTFSGCFPSLKYLTLSSCLFANGDSANLDGSICINLEQHSLTTLTLMDDRNRGRFDKIHQSKLFTPTLFHLELTSQQTDVYLMLLPLHTIPLVINKEQHEMWSKQPYTIIDISCGSIDTIIIRLGHISHALDVKKYV